MADHEPFHDSSLPGEPGFGDEGSTVAADLAAIAAGSESARTASLASSSTTEEPKSAESAGSSVIPAPLSADKTVISKRPPPEPSLPLLPTPQTLGQALVGKTLDHYVLQEFVGGGGMGAVFRSTDTRLGRTVAVKVLSRDHTDEETIKRFRNEAQSAARLDHPHIARVYFVGEAEGWNYIVFEYIEGTNLRDMVEARGPLPLEEALHYTLQVAEALDHASQRDVVHRDIKPSNVLVTPGGHVKLVDMGLARLHQVESSSEDLTASGVMLGTFDYISPEQARDPRSADVRSDIYSLGCTLYFMLAGRPPFPEGTAVQKLLKHNSEDPPDLRLFQPDLPQGATALVGRMLAKRPTQRQQSPQELIAEILALAHQLGLSSLVRQTHVAAAPASSSRNVLSRVLSIVVPVAALVLLLWLVDSLSRQGGAPLHVANRPQLKEPPLGAAATSGQETIADASAAAAPKQASDGGATADLTGNHTAAVGADAEGSDGASSRRSVGSSSPGNGGSNVEGSELEQGSSGKGTSGTTAPATAVESIRGSEGVAGSEKPALNRIIVRRQSLDPTAAADTKIVSSLAQACQLAAEYGIAKIELEFDGPLEEQPFDLTQQRIQIAGASGFRPVVLFRPQQFDTERDRQMIRLVGGSRSQVTFERVELRLELPSDASAGWALIAIYQVQSLDLIDSILTVKDAAGLNGLSLHEPVAMLALQKYRPAEMMKMTDEVMAMLPSINVQLTNCIARGEATFLTAVEERPMNIFWNQGLLVTPLRMLDAKGSALTRPTPQDKFEIELDHVTAIVPGGLVHQNRNGMPSQQRLEIRCYDSLLAWDEGNFLLTFEGLTSRDEVKLDFEGNQNLYPTSNGGILRVGSETYDWDRWGRGSDSRSGKVEWLDGVPPPSLAEKPAHEHVPADYQLDPDSERGGFDLEILRRILDRPSAAANAANSSGTEADFFERPLSPPSLP